MWINELLRQCEQYIKQGSSTFYKAFRSLPSPRREAVYVIYAFCRMLDDSIDEPDDSIYTLQELKSHLLELDRVQDMHFIWPSLRWLFQQFPALTLEPFLKQIEGQQMDTRLTHYETFEQMERYCELVAGSVGEMLLPVLHHDPDERIAQAGVTLGKAMQIVNVIRDVGEDLSRGRCYLPKEWMDAYGVTSADIDNRNIHAGFKSLIQALMGKSEQWFQEGMYGLETYPRSSAMAIELAAVMYAAILKEVKKNQYDVFTRRAFVKDSTKRAIVMRLTAKYALRHRQEPVVRAAHPSSVPVTGG